MDDKKKTKTQLLEELRALRLELLEAKTQYMNDAEYLRLQESRDTVLYMYKSSLEEVSQHKQVEAGLRRNQFLMDEAQKIGKFGIWEYDLDTQSVWGSTGSYAIMGLEPGTFTPDHESINKFILPQERDKVLQHLADAIEGHQPYDLIFGANHPDGTNHYFHVQAQILKKTDGSPERLIGTIQDVTHRMLAEKNLRTSEKRNRLILEHAGVGIGFWDNDHKIIMLNDAAAAEMGGVPDDFMDKSMLDLFPKDDAAEYIQRLQHAQQQDETVVYEDVVNLSSGRKHYLSKYTRVVDTKNTITGVLIVSHDVTELKQIEFKLRRTKNRLEEAERIAKFGSWDWNLKTKEVWWSKGLFRVYKRDRSLGIPGYENDQWLQDTIHPEDRERLNNAVTAAIENGADYDIEFRILCPQDDEHCWIHAVGETVFDDDRTPERFIGIAQDITERKNAEDAYRTLVDQSVQALVILRDGRVVFANPRLSEITGYSLDEYKNMTAEEFIATVHPDDRATVAENMQKRLRGEPAPNYYTARGLCKDGTTWWVEMHPKVIQYKGKTAVQVVALDVTEKILAARALAKSEQRYRKAEQVAHVGYYDINVKTGAAVWSDETFRIFDMPVDASEPMVAEYAEFVHPEDRKALFDMFERSIAEKEKFDLVYRIITKRKSVKYIHSIGEIETDTHGDVCRMFGTFQDVTARINAGNTLRESEEKFRVLADSLPAAVAMYDQQKVIYANYGWEPLLGYTKEEAETVNPFSIIDPSMRNIIMQRAADRLAGKDVPRSYDALFLTKNGEPKWAELHVTRFLFKGTWCLLVIATDLEERKSMQQKLKERVDELQRLNKLMVGRENRMIELKHEINDLCEKAGIPNRYHPPDLNGNSNSTQE